MEYFFYYYKFPEISIIINNQFALIITKFILIDLVYCIYLISHFLGNIIILWFWDNMPKK